MHTLLLHSDRRIHIFGVQYLGEIIMALACPRFSMGLQIPGREAVNCNYENQLNIDLAYLNLFILRFCALSSAAVIGGRSASLASSIVSKSISSSSNGASF